MTLINFYYFQLFSSIFNTAFIIKIKPLFFSSAKISVLPSKTKPKNYINFETLSVGNFSLSLANVFINEVSIIFIKLLLPNYFNNYPNDIEANYYFSTFGLLNPVFLNCNNNSIIKVRIILSDKYSVSTVFYFLLKAINAYHASTSPK